MERKEFMKNTKELFRIPLMTIIAGLILTMSIFFVSLDAVKSYKAEMKILVVPISPAAAQQRDAIIETIAQLPRMYAFYERLISTNNELLDFAKGKTLDEKKSSWNSVVSSKVEKNGNSSFIVLTAKGATGEDAELIVQKSAKTLFDLTSRNFNIKDDISISVVDGPFVRPTSINLAILLFGSLAFGFGIAYILNLILEKIQQAFMKNAIGKAKAKLHQKIENKSEGKIQVEKNEISKAENEPQTSQVFNEQLSDEKEQKIMNERIASAVEEARLIHNKVDRDQYPNFPEMPVRSPQASTKAAPSNLPIAPDNLPIVDDAYMQTFMQNQTPNVQESQPEPESQRARDTEPTDEELKRRLNQLLKGKI